MNILIITDTATHPVVAGNRARMVALAGLMREQGHRVECVFLPRQSHPYDEAAAQAFWHEGYYPYRPRVPLSKKLKYRIKQLLPGKGRVTPVAARKPEYYRIDDWYREEWTPHVEKVIRQTKPDAVMVEYVYMSKVLEAVPEGVLKIIDTHDKFTDRDRIYREAGKEPVFFYTREEEEARGLRRADRIMAISEEESEFFEQISGVPSYYIPHPVEIHHVGEPEKPVVGFLGSNNDINRMGLEWFLREIWPEVKLQISEASLKIAGTIGEAFRESSPGVDIIIEGRMELKAFYGSVSVVVNPLLGGTGQKIKLIEALGYGKPVVTTTAGASGIKWTEVMKNNRADDAVSFTCKLIEILKSSQCRFDFIKSAHEFCKDYNININKNISLLLQKSS